MDTITLVMFAFTFMIGFVFTIFGFSELKTAITKKETPFLGFIYFIVSMLVWFVIAIYWVVVATDPALAALSWLWYGLGGTSLTCAMACVGFIFKASATPDEEMKRFGISERERD